MGNRTFRAGRCSRSIVREQLALVSSAASRPSVRDRFVAFGSNPIRVLLIGNGIALGYGVSRRADTLDGHIGAQLANRTRRGVLVNNHTSDSARLEEQAQSVVAGMNLQSEDIVVWCPSYSEVLERWRAGYWRDTMTTFLAHVSSTVHVVLVEVPMIESNDFETSHLNRSIRRINQALIKSARDFPNALVYSPPVVNLVLGREHLYNAAYYAGVGAGVADVVLRERFGIDAEVPLASRPNRAGHTLDRRALV